MMIYHGRAKLRISGFEGMTYHVLLIGKRGICKLIVYKLPHIEKLRHHIGMCFYQKLIAGALDNIRMKRHIGLLDRELSRYIVAFRDYSFLSDCIGEG